MKLKVCCHLDYQTSEPIPIILVLRLRKSQTQVILSENFEINPNVNISEYIDLYGNYCQRLMSPIGDFSIKTSAIVETEEFIKVGFDADFMFVQNLPQDTLVYLLPSRYCESDKLNAKALEIIKGLSKGYEMVEAIRQWVRANIKYEYNHSTSSTSALDTLKAKHGVCRDLSHLAIGLCRSINIPARFVVGYMYSLYPMDLHAWFEVYLDHQWHTFDATQEYVTGGRVVLAYGRDASDVATATYFGNMQLKNMFVDVEQLS